MSQVKAFIIALYLSVLATQVWADSCPFGMRSCEGTSECIEHEFFCDTWKDCSNGWDESFENCPCKENEFRCKDDSCVPKDWVCDDQKDCAGGEDEEGCVCGGFVCDDEECIPGEWKCDGEPDCSKGEDEIGCGTRPPSCGIDQFECTSGKCIPKAHRCDGWPDCENGEDEVACPCKKFECANGQCIPSDWECDGEADCDDWSDEKHCTCKEDEFFCGACVKNKYKCDCPVDCPDGSDEGDHCDYEFPCRPPTKNLNSTNLNEHKSTRKSIQKRVRQLKVSHEQEITSSNNSPGRKLKELMQITRREARRKLNLRKLQEEQQAKSSVLVAQLRHSQSRQ